MNIVNDAENDVRDIRRELPRLMETLGVNTSEEHQVFHATLIWIIGEMAKFAPVGAEAVATEIASIL